ncbi:MAG: transcription antitermination factor NusB [Frankiales bacterium]|nr:transcription antitermination factor NusB [Frankiales bacterium]
MLYEAGLRGADPMQVLRERLAQSDPPVPEYATELVEGVVVHQERIDELLSTYAEQWTLERMPPVDLAALRIGTYELLWCPDVPDGVAVSEAVALVGSLSTEESAGFVNGLLARVLQLKPSLST